MSTPRSGRFLLDTNIVIALLAGEESVLSHLDRAQEVFVPAVVLGELFWSGEVQSLIRELGQGGALREVSVRG